MDPGGRSIRRCSIRGGALYRLASGPYSNDPPIRGSYITFPSRWGSGFNCALPHPQQLKGGIMNAAAGMVSKAFLLTKGLVHLVNSATLALRPGTRSPFCSVPLMCILSHPPPLESRVRFQFHRVLTTPAVLRCGVVISPPPDPKLPWLTHVLFYRYIMDQATITADIGTILPYVMNIHHCPAPKPPPSLAHGDPQASGLLITRLHSRLPCDIVAIILTPSQPPAWNTRPRFTMFHTQCSTA